MGDPMQVAADERGLVRVFAVDVEAAEAPRWLDSDSDSADWPLPAALGVARLDPDAVQVVRAGELGEIGLRGLLAAGHGVDEDRLARDRETLDAEAGLVAVIRSSAFDGPAELRPRAPLRLLGVYAEPGAPLSFGEVGDYRSAHPSEAPAPSETPAAEDDGEPAREVFRPDRDRYIRDHLWLAAIGMVGATAVLWLVGNDSYWVGAVAALLAVGVRGWYLASEELAQSWELTPAAVRSVSAEGAHRRSIALADVAQVRRLGSAVQVISRGGEKMLLKYMAEPDRVRARITAATEAR